MKVNNVHLFFEQSGTFKTEFQKLGVTAYDYDLQNNFGQTDWQGDLFAQINEEFEGRPSLFDAIKYDDLIIAFFPCIYFCEMSSIYFMGVSYNQSTYSPAAKILNILERSRLREEYYTTLLKLFFVCEVRKLRLIVENPYNAHHYLRFNFPYKPAVIDMNRRLKGDFFKKPTQYFFLNCEPAGKSSLQLDKAEKYIRDQKRTPVSGLCSEERSMIAPDYARNFICDHILGIDTGHTQPTLF